MHKNKSLEIYKDVIKYKKKGNILIRAQRCQGYTWLPSCFTGERNFVFQKFESQSYESKMLCFCSTKLPCVNHYVSEPL